VLINNIQSDSSVFRGLWKQLGV